MKLFGTDIHMRYIIANVDGKSLLVAFHETKMKGIHDVLITIDGQETEIKIKNAYPGLVQWIREVASLVRVEIRCALKHSKYPKTKS